MKTEPFTNEIKFILAFQRDFIFELFFCAHLIEGKSCMGRQGHITLLNNCCVK